MNGTAHTYKSYATFLCYQVRRRVVEWGSLRAERAGAALRTSTLYVPSAARLAPTPRLLPPPSPPRPPAQKSSVCSPYTYQNITDVTGAVIGGGFMPNPRSVYNEEMLPRYQTQTTFLKNGLNNAASFGNGAQRRQRRAGRRGARTAPKPPASTTSSPCLVVQSSARSSSASWVRVAATATRRRNRVCSATRGASRHGGAKARSPP